jgi:hypothetical protein
MAVGISNAGPEGKICTDLGLSQGPSGGRAVVTIICSRRPLGRRAGNEEREGARWARSGEQGVRP